MRMKFYLLTLLAATSLMISSCNEEIEDPDQQDQNGEQLDSSDFDVEVNYENVFVTSLTPGQEFNWKFGDDSTASGKSYEHQYAVPGTYTIELSVKTKDGDRLSEKEVTVEFDRAHMLSRRWRVTEASKGGKEWKEAIGANYRFFKDNRYRAGELEFGWSWGDSQDELIMGAGQSWATTWTVLSINSYEMVLSRVDQNLGELEFTYRSDFE